MGYDSSRPVESPPTLPTSVTGRKRHQKESIEANADHLRGYFQDEIVMMLINPVDDLEIDAEVFHRVHR